MPVNGEPRRRPATRALSGIARLLEIAVVDLVEARRGEVDADQLGLGRKTAGDLGAQIALAIDPVGISPEGLHPDHPRNSGEPVGHAGAERLDIDNMTATQYAAGQFR